MTSIVETWNRLAGAAKVGLGVGVLLIVALMAGVGFWAYRADYQVLFADVAPADAASMTAELDRLKTPYQLTDGGNTILVPKDLVYKTRLKLMGKELPLHGAVGFEVFNNADFGMTEFVQKVNYLRAVQGELTRTILAIEEIQAARVHLAIPEQGLFKAAAGKPKASVTVTTKPGRTLAPEQIAGIQRLVAASVPDIVSGDVTVLNQHGVALTRMAQADGGGDSGSFQLDSKRSTEDYLVKKVTQVLDSTFGPGHAVASVDVALNLDQSKVTTDEPIAAKGPADMAAAGVVVHERQTSYDGSGPAAATPAKAGSNSSESDYQVGHRVEQLVAATGTVKRMTIAVLVKQPLTEAQLEKLKQVVTLAVGFNSQRGDAVVVYSMDQFAGPAGAGVDAAVPAALAAAATDLRSVPPASPGGHAAAASRPVAQVVQVALLAALVLAVLLYLVWRRARQPAAVRLDPAARAALLNDVRRWIAAPGAAPGAEPAPQGLRK